MIENIIKRNQEIVPFERDKIEAAVFKALVVAERSRSRQTLRNLSISVTDRVIYDIYEQCKEEIPSVEEIQDAVELALMKMGEHETAKAYIKYRYKHLEQRESKKTAMDILTVFKDYIDHTPWQDTTDYSLQGLNHHIISKATKHFWLYQVYSESVRKAHELGDLHIHDLGLLSTYCCGWSLEDLLKDGYGGFKGHISSAPAKHFESVLMQLANFVQALQGEAAGAQSFSNFDTLLAPYVRQDQLSYANVKQHIQSFVFNMNVPHGSKQAPIFSITLDKEVPEAYKDLPVLLNGHYHHDLSYGDYQNEMDMINKALCEVMMTGDDKGRYFSFPIPIYNVTDHWNWQNDTANRILEMTAKYGMPYYSNQKHLTSTHENDYEYHQKHDGGIFGAHPLSGTIGVVTINMARLGYVSSDLENFFERLERMMAIAKDALETKRSMLEENMKLGLYPYSKQLLKKVYDKHGVYWQYYYATIGPTGLNECVMNLTNNTENIGTEVGKDLAEEILDFMNEVLMNYQNETKHLYNLESSPTENTSFRFAALDLERYPDIHVSGDETPYYTNTTVLPDQLSEDLFDTLDMQASIQLKYSGGNVFHGHLDEAISDLSIVKNTLVKVMKEYKIPYFSLSPKFSTCPTHRYIPGSVNECPHCHEATEIWSNKEGYIKPLMQWETSYPVDILKINKK